MLLGKVKGLVLAEMGEESNRGGQAESSSLLKKSFIQASVHDAMFDLHVPGQVALQGELAGAVEAFEGLAVRVQMHVAHKIVHSIELLSTKLAFVGLDVRVDDHVSLQRLFLHKALEAHVALVCPDVGVDQNVALHVGQEGELTAADPTLVLLHSFVCERVLFEVV